MCDSQRPTNGADSATGIDRERILQRVNAYGAPSPCPHCGQQHVRRVPEWVRRAQEKRLTVKDMTGKTVLR
jgi:hypothetical protein